jgi:hypothetical protein
MSVRRFVLFSAGGRRLVFPVEAVKSIRDWEEPLPIPRSKQWLLGVLEGEGEAIPVLGSSFWGGGGVADHMLLLLDLSGRLLAVAGGDPDILPLDCTWQEENDPGDGLIAGTIAVADRTAECVRVDKLYSALGLRYNNTDRIGGVDAEKDSFSR